MLELVKSTFFHPNKFGVFFPYEIEKRLFILQSKEVTPAVEHTTITLNTAIGTLSGHTTKGSNFFYS